MSGAQNRAPHPLQDEPPPILGTWRHIYLVVILYLAFLIVAFYIFARAFAE